VGENKKDKLKIIIIIFTDFRFGGNEVEKPLKVDSGTLCFEKHSWNKIGVHCALKNKGKDHQSCNLSNNVIDNTALDTKGLLPCAFGYQSYYYCHNHQHLLYAGYLYLHS
jgi:hypothetical protein